MYVTHKLNQEMAIASHIITEKYLEIAIKWLFVKIKLLIWHLTGCGLSSCGENRCNEL